jgi:hypothetical protein
MISHVEQRTGTIGYSAAISLTSNRLSKWCDQNGAFHLVVGCSDAAKQRSNDLSVVSIFGKKPGCLQNSAAEEISESKIPGLCLRANKSIIVSPPRHGTDRHVYVRPMLCAPKDLDCRVARR